MLVGGANTDSQPDRSPNRSPNDSAHANRQHWSDRKRRPAHVDPDLESVGITSADSAA